MKRLTDEHLELIGNLEARALQRVTMLVLKDEAKERERQRQSALLLADVYRLVEENVYAEEEPQADGDSGTQPIHRVVPND